MRSVGNHPTAFFTNNIEKVRIDTSGRLLVGTSSARVLGQGIVPNVQVEGVNNVSAGSLALTENRSADTLGSRLVLTKTRGSALAATTIVQNGDEFGSIYFCGADGTNADIRGAYIQAFVDGTPGTNDMPGRLVFSTTADGASNPTERLRITSGGRVGIGTSNPLERLDVAGTVKCKNVRENVFNITWSSSFALNPLNGETKFVVLGGNSTPTQSGWDNGESITLHIDDGASRTITWTTLGVVWTGGSAPTLATTGDTVVQLWKAGNVIYGALVGEVA